MTDAYQQVYHDDSSTHGSRTLDSRFSRDKYDLSDEQQTDEDEDEPTQKSINGHPSASPTYVYRSSEPFHINSSNASEFQHPMDQINKGKGSTLPERLSLERNEKKMVLSHHYDATGGLRDDLMSL